MGTRKQTPVDRIAGLIVVDAGGERYTLKFGINAMCLVEELVGDLTGDKLRLNGTFRTLVWAGLVCGGVHDGTPFEGDLVRAGDIIDRLTVEDREAIMKAFMDAQPRKASDSKKK